MKSMPIHFPNSKCIVSIYLNPLRLFRADEASLGNLHSVQLRRHGSHITDIKTHKVLRILWVKMNTNTFAAWQLGITREIDIIKIMPSFS
jgi:hypothetical protein